MSLRAMADIVTPMAIRVAATLRIADHLVRGPRTAGELAAIVEADADALERMLQHLTANGVVSQDASGGYSLTALGEALRDDDPAGARAALDIEGGVGRGDLTTLAADSGLRVAAIHPAEHTSILELTAFESSSLHQRFCLPQRHET